MTRLIAIDCSTERLVLALACGARRFVRDEPGGPESSARALPAIAELLDEAGLNLADLDAVAFARGPGAFTGLRTACALAQGLAFGADKPVVAVDSLLVVAEATRVLTETPCADLWVAMDARMQEVYAALYAWHDGSWQTLQAPALWTAAALARELQAQPGPRVVGSAVTAGLVVSAHCACAAPDSPGAPNAPEASRGHALLRLALTGWSAGERLDPAQALPLYLRDKVAQTTQEREQARRGALSASGAQP